ncbi:hypothetical protein BWQ96_01017 [Gracilariopsis chorda]|uniref:Uncharacterized protein n=1 Tax=Gracilariopsis chorda TaxID=448386 RepID=A0A2V3J486_9FLOR|nr:hypothetical protein BWQ96_01017 [Gracilariopsis chorda]|eukprot:PXF49228.1 hypothetical protein BWQ96_01017 [Gracilariopsis chorda]
MDGVENEPDAGNDDMVGGCSVLQVRYAKRLLALQKAADVTAELQQSESHEVCSRCLGKGYLTCMACSSD